MKSGILRALHTLLHVAIHALKHGFHDASCNVWRDEGCISINISASGSGDTFCSIPSLKGCIDTRQLQLKHVSTCVRLLHNLPHVPSVNVQPAPWIG
jgi:hypothetical protein